MKVVPFVVCIALLVAPFTRVMSAEVRYVKEAKENLRDAPKGRKLGELNQATEMKVLETQGNWMRVSVEGWIWKPSTTEDKVVKSAAKKTPPAKDTDPKGDTKPEASGSDKDS